MHLDHPRSPLAGGTALVTGGAKRLGRAVCEALARQGVNVVLHYNTSEREALELAERLRGTGVSAWTVRADLSRASEAEEVMSRAISSAGPVHFLVNNASIFPSDTLGDVSAESVAVNVQINALAPLALSRTFAAQRGTGAIVNFLDTRMLDYDREHVSYHLSKRMLFTITRMLALEFAPDIRVNGVAPGLVLPPAGQDQAHLERLAHTNPLNRVGCGEDVARAVVFLLENEFITGQIVYVDGGRHLKSGVYH